MRLDRAWIGAHLPHQGSMCLLDEVLSWDAQQLRCRSTDHRANGHPLRAHGRLGSVCAIEYAAQAAALHGALLRSCNPAQAATAGSLGMIASARSVELAVARLDDIAEELLISARRLHGDAHSALYAFVAGTHERWLARGRLSLWLDAAQAPTLRPPAGRGGQRA